MDFKNKKTDCGIARRVSLITLSDLSTRSTRVERKVIPTGFCE